MIKRFFVGLIFCLSVMGNAQAKVTLEMTQGKDARVPIVIIPFAINDNGLTAIIRADLENSGRFRAVLSQEVNHQPHTPATLDGAYWQGQGYEDSVVGKVTVLPDGRYQVSYSLVDLFGSESETVLSSQQYTVNKAQLRQLAHTISNDIYYQLTGYRGFFTAHLAYVLVQKKSSGTRYKLMVSDYDGYGPKLLVDSNVPMLSPRWSPDNKKIAYVTFAEQGSVVTLVTLATGKREVIAHYKGMNSAPSWSPDGSKLAVVLSGRGSPNLYLLTLATKGLQSLTTGEALSSEPEFSPDGSFLLFTSSRHDDPQIYRLNLADRRVSQWTTEGDYNASAAISPMGDWVALLHREEGAGLFSIAVKSLQNGVLKELTASGLNQSPSFSPGGQMIVYAHREVGSPSRLAMVSLDGKAQWLVPAEDGSMQEPDFSR